MLKRLINNIINRTENGSHSLYRCFTGTNEPLFTLSIRHFFSKPRKKTLDTEGFTPYLCDVNLTYHRGKSIRL